MSSIAITRYRICYNKSQTLKSKPRFKINPNKDLPSTQN